MKKKNNYLRSIVTILLCLACLGANAQKGKPWRPNISRGAKVGPYVGGVLDQLPKVLKQVNQGKRSWTPQGVIGRPNPFIDSLYKSHPTFDQLTIGNPSAKDLYNAVRKGMNNNPDIAMKLLRQSADMGYAKAQYTYALYNYWGQYTQKNISVAYKYFEKAAKQNHPASCYILGDANYFGIDGFKQDSIKALNWYKKSADNGYVLGQIATGDLYFTAKDTKNAIKYWEMANDNPNIFKLTEDDMSILAQSAYNVGWFYYNGEGIEKNESKGIDYFKKAAECGHSYSAYYLGLLYREGTDLTPQSDEMACAYIEQSALLGYPEGEGLYGDYCQFGIGMERDSLQSIKWYKKAYQDGYTQTAYPLAWHYANTEEKDSIIAWGTKPECCDSVDIQYSVGAAFYNKEDYDNAEIWWKKAASQELPEAFWGLYAICEIIKNDSVAGFEYLKQAADLGYPDALCDMGYNYLNGYMVNKDVEKARDYFRKASEKGNSLAFNNLGISYCDKAYINKFDWKTAADYFRKGAEMNCQDAQYNYAICLKKGKGVKKDKHAAIHWFKLAAQNGDEDAANELKRMGINFEPQNDDFSPKNKESETLVKPVTVTSVDNIGITYK